MAKLPQGWVECQIGEVFNIERGGSPRPIKEYLTTSLEGINWIKIGDTKNTSKYIFETKEKIKPEGLKHSRFVNIGDLILSNSMSFGRPYIMKTTGCIHDGWVVFRNPYKIAIEDFLYYLLSSPNIYSKFSIVATGSTVKNLNIDRIKGISIIIPPLKEQRRIVEKIESEFAKIDEGLEHLEQAKEKIKQYRQSVLKSAFEGKIYKTSHWQETILKEVSNKISDGSHNPPPKQQVGIPMLSGQNIKNGQIIFDDFRLISEKDFDKEYRRTPIEENDILLTIVGTIGESAVVSKNTQKFVLQRSVALIKPNNINSQFLKYYFDSPISKYYFKTQERGTAQKGIYLNTLKHLPLLLPTMIEQKWIVKEIEKRFAVADEVEKVVDDNIEKAKQLKQSILKKAFEGRLVPQDLTDEPASILLEKIKKEKHNDRK